MKRQEQKGELISDFYRSNITKKAIVERWELDILAKQQEKAKIEKAERERKKAEEQAEQARKEKEKQKVEEQRQFLIEQFEVLSPKQQENVINEIFEQVGKGAFKQIFQTARQQGTVHIDARFVKNFYNYFQQEERAKKTKKLDVFAVQLIGKKHWTISAPNFDMPLYMQQAKDMPHITPSKTVDMEVILEAGDILYIPRGWWHNPMPMNCETFHLAIGTFPPNGYNYMEWLMKKIPDIQSIRQNFIDWEHDQKNIDNAAQAVTEMMKNQENYQAFIQDFLGNQRVNTAFNMQIFGNLDNDRLPENSTIKLNSLDNRTIKQGYIIANGIKTNLDNDSQTILQWIADKHSVKLTQLYEFCQNQNINLEKVEKLVFDLTMIDVLECLTDER
ncbi:TPA: cupin domain-containing protein [Neisseria meningitidis]